MRELRKSKKRRDITGSSGGRCSVPMMDTGSEMDPQLQADALEEDLSAVLKAITEGVESGVIKVGVCDCYVFVT